MKKFLSIVVILALVVSASSVFAAEKKVKLQIWEWISNQGEGPVYKQVIESYMKEHPNVEIEMLTNPWNQAHDKILIMSQANKMPDIIGVNRNWLMEFVSMDLIEDLTPYVEQVPGMREKFYEPLRGEMGGKVYILPYSGGNAALVINKKVFAEMGLTPPTTLDEFVEISKKLSNAAEGKYATQFGLAEKNVTGANVCNIGPILYSFGGKYVENKKAAFNSPEGVAALQWMVDLEQQKLAGPGSITVDARGMRERFAGGQAFMTFDGSWGTPFYNKYPEVEFEVVKMPKGKYVGTVVNIMCWGISKSSKNKEAAWDLLNYIMSDENLLKLFKEANVMPNMPKYGELPEFQEKYKGFLETLAASKNFFQTGSVPQESQLYKILTQAYHEAFLGKKSPQQALDDAAKKYNMILEEFYAE